MKQFCTLVPIDSLLYVLQPVLRNGVGITRQR